MLGIEPGIIQKQCYPFFLAIHFYFSCCFSMCIYCQSLLYHHILIITFIAILHTLLCNKHYCYAQLIDKGTRIKESRSSASQQQAYILIVLNFFFSKAPFLSHFYLSSHTQTSMIFFPYLYFEYSLLFFI